MLETIQTTRTELQEQLDTPQVQFTSLELLNNKNLKDNSNPIDNSMFCSLVGCGNNTEETKKSFDVSMSDTNRVFVLSYNGKALTPCRPQKARKLLMGGVAKVVWNRFGEFGIQMLVSTREFTPKVVLGIDNGTKFEGYSLIVGEENKLNVMWLLPDKKKLIKKLEERRHLRRAKRWRNCKRRECRFNNRSRQGFIAPSQLMMVNSRLKAISEFFKYYPIEKVAIEDVKFNHRDKRWGKNFSTIEVGKNMIKSFIIDKVGREGYITFEGFETQEIRERNNLKKSSNKSLETFNSHCVDSFSIASEISKAQPNFKIKVIDDTYRPTRRKLHDTQPSKDGIRENYSTGNFQRIRKGTICEFGQIVGGTKNNVWIRNSDNKRIGRDIKKVGWYSKHFKVKQEVAIPPTNKLVGFLAPLI